MIRAYVNRLSPQELGEPLMQKTHDQYLVDGDAGFLAHVNNFAESRRRLAEAARVAVQWKAKAEEAEAKAAESTVNAFLAAQRADKYMGLYAGAEKKLKEQAAELEREKEEFISTANKLSSEKSSLEVLVQERAAEIERVNKLHLEESELRIQGEEKNKYLEEMVKKLQADLAAQQAEAERLKAEKGKVIAGLPRIVKKFIHSTEFQKPLAAPFDTCIHLGRHQACCKVLAEAPGYDKALFGDFYNDDALELLKFETEKMFLNDYPFLFALSALADKPSEVILSLEPPPKE